MILTREININKEQPVFKGHFPGKPVLPGVLFLTFIKDIVSKEKKSPYRIKTILKQKFLKVVTPDCRLIIKCSISPVDNNLNLLMTEGSGWVDSFCTTKFKILMERIQ